MSRTRHRVAVGPADASIVPSVCGSPGVAVRPAASRTRRAWRPTPDVGGSLLTTTARTVRAWSAPDRPPTWSAWSWVRTSRSRLRTPSRLRQPSTRPGSGPVSRRAARPGPVATTVAAPWPTSHWTTAQPGGGQRPAPSSSAVTPPHPAPAASTPAHVTGTRTDLPAGGPLRARGRLERILTRARTPSAIRPNSATPAPPCGHGTVPPGTSASPRATTPTQRQLQPATQARTWATGGHSGATSAASSPSTVAGAIAGSTSRFAGTDTRLTPGASSSSTGAQASCAATGAAMATARTRGSLRARRDTSGGPSRSRPPVAVADSAKPNERASHGSSASSTITAADSAGTPAARRPRHRPTSPTAVMAAARTTLGSGLASTTKPATAAAATPSRGPRRSLRRASSTAPPTMARLAPLTAVRWVRPEARIAASRSSASALVSPTTSPGRSPATSGWSPPTASRSPSRNGCAARHQAAGRSRTSGAVVGWSSATAGSPGSVARTRAVNPTADPSGRLDQRASPRTITGTRTDRLAPCRPTSRVRARISHRRAPSARCQAGASSRGCTRAGSAVSTATTRTTRPCAAACGRPLACRSARPAAAGQAATVAAARPSATADRGPGRPRERIDPGDTEQETAATATAAAQVAAVPHTAATRAVTTGTAVRTQAVPQAATAGPTSRRSAKALHRRPASWALLSPFTPGRGAAGARVSARRCPGPRPGPRRWRTGRGSSDAR